MARFESFDRDIRLVTAGLEPEAISGALAALAKSELARVIASGEASISYERFVNGRQGAPEEAVEVPGPIVYVFSWWGPILTFAMEYLRKRSPRHSGRYVDSWFVMVNGGVVGDFSAVPVGAEVIITNRQPYHRKIDVGHMKMSVPPGVVEDARQVIRRRFGAVVTVERNMILLQGGYVLKGHFSKGVRPSARKRLQRDTEAGQPMTYPALVMTMKAA